MRCLGFRWSKVHAVFDSGFYMVRDPLEKHVRFGAWHACGLGYAIVQSMLLGLSSTCT